MPEDVENNCVLPKFTIPVTETLREFLDNDTTTRDKITLNGLGMKKDKSISVSVIMKIGTEVAEYCTVLNYRPPIPQKGVGSEDI